MKIKEDEFRDLLEKAKVPVVADFYADWCGPCRSFAPIYNKVAEKLKGEFSFVKLDIDHCEPLVEELMIDAVPTVMIFEHSKQIARHDGGFQNEAELEKFITESVLTK